MDTEFLHCGCNLIFKRFYMKLALKDRAMVQAVSRLSVTAGAGVLSQVSPCDIGGGQSGTGIGLSPSITDFSLPKFFH